MLGKSIIFAQNKKHADFILERYKQEAAWSNLDEIMSDSCGIRKNFKGNFSCFEERRKAMQFLINAYDGKNMLEKRMEVRPRHLSNIDELGKHVVFAGGRLNEEGKPVGSVMVMDFDTREDLEKYLETEPYIKEHVWEDVDVEVFNVVILGGEKVGK